MQTEDSRESTLANLPPLPEGWYYRALEDLVDRPRSIAYGIVQPGSPTPNGTPIVRVQDVRDGTVDRSAPLRVAPMIADKYRRTRLHGGELLVTLVGTVGLTAVVPPELEGWNVARAIGVVPIRREVGAPYVAYALRHPKIQALLAAWCNTTVQATLNLKELARIPVPMAPAYERARITSLLGALDSKIALNRRMNHTLEATAAALFRSWFVDFDPVWANVDGRRAIGVSAVVQQLMPSHFVEAEDRRIPDGWRLGPFQVVARLAREQVHAESIAPKTPYIALEHMPRRSIALGTWRPAGRLDSAKWRYARGDVLFGKLRPYFHKVGIAPNDGVCSTEIFVMKPTTPEWYGLLACTASSREFVDYASAAAEGTRMPRVSWAYLARFQVVLPPLQLASQFTQVVRPLFERITANVHESRTLAALRETLLPQLLSGATRLRDAERSVAAAI